MLNPLNIVSESIPVNYCPNRASLYPHLLSFKLEQVLLSGIHYPCVFIPKSYLFPDYTLLTWTFKPLWVSLHKTDTSLPDHPSSSGSSLSSPFLKVDAQSCTPCSRLSFILLCLSINISSYLLEIPHLRQPSIISAWPNHNVASQFFHEN